METCSCFEPLKNGLKIAFHSNGMALEFTKNNQKPPNSRTRGFLKINVF